MKPQAIKVGEFLLVNDDFVAQLEQRLKRVESFLAADDLGDFGEMLLKQRAERNKNDETKETKGI